MEKFEQQIKKVHYDNVEKTIKSMESEGWEVVSASSMYPYPETMLIFKRPNQSLNADIRNKLCPFQTLLDILSVYDLHIPKDMPAISQLFDETLSEAKKSLKYLKTIGE